jgi:hypothetical protein
VPQGTVAQAGRRSARPVVVGLLAAVALAVLAGCGGSDGPSAEELVARSVEATAAVGSFHLVVNVENVPPPSGGLGLTFVDGDIVVPDRMAATVGGTFQGIPLSSELVVIGDDHWLKIPFTERWQKVDVGLTVARLLDPADGVLPVLEGATELERAGSEEVDGVDTYRIEGMVRLADVAPLLGVEEGAELVPVELWIGKDDELLRRLRLSGAIAPGEGSDAVRTVELSGFDEPVEITPPTAS